MVEPPARQRGRLQSMLPAGLFLLGLAVAAFVGLQVQRSVDKAEAEEFVRSTDRVAQEVVRRFEQPVYGLNGARGVYAAHPQTNRSAFRAYVESRDLAGEFPGVRGLGFIQRVPIAGVEPFLAAERADGAPQFAIRRLSQQSQGDLYVIKLIEPARSNAGAAGLDVGSEANRRAAIERAIASGLPTMTAPISLVQAARRTPGLLLFVPAFHPDQPQSTPDERRQALRGVLYAPIVYAELLAGLVDVVGGRIGIRVLDDGAAMAAEVEVFSAAPAPAVADGADPTAVSRHTAMRALSLPGRTLMLEVRSTPAFEASFQSRTPWLVFASGALASALLAALLRQQATGRRRAEDLAQRMTVDLDRLAKVAQRTSNAVIITDRALQITWVNEAFTQLYGYSGAQALGRSPADLLCSRSTRPEAIEQLRRSAERGVGCRVEVVHRTADGREIWVDTEVQPSMNAAGEVVGFVEIASDITEGRLASQQIAEQRQRLANIIDGTQAGTWERDLVSGDCRVNALFATMIGRELEACTALVRDGFTSLVHPDDLKVLDLRWAAHLAGESPELEVEFRLRHQAGHWVWVQSRGRVSARDPQGRALVIAGIHLDISARRQAEDALHASRAFLDRTGRIAGVGGWSLDPTALSLQWTDETCRIHDLPPGCNPTLEEVVLFYAPEARTQITDAVQQCAADGRSFDLELPLLTATGRAIWVRVVGEAECEDGAVLRVVGAFQDITERRAMAEARQRSNELMSSVLENLPCGLSVFDGNLHLVAVNRMMREMLDLPDSLFAQQPVRFEDVIRFNASRGEYGHEQVDATVQAIIERARAPAVPHHFERVRPDGTPLEIRGGPLPGGGFVTTYIDISERRRAEAELQRSAALLRGAIDALDEAFVLYDPDDRLVLCNDRYREIYANMAPLMVPGARFEDIVRAGAEQGDYAEAVGRVDEWVAERLRAHRAANTTLVQRLADGRTLRIIERKTPDGHIVGFRIDITELVRASEASQAASQAKSQFLANMSHEIRTPMNAILGMLALLRKTELSPRQADYAVKTEGAARSLLGLLNDILDFSKVEAGKMSLDPHPFRFDQLLRDLSVILSANVGAKPVELLFDLDPALPRQLIGDPLRLQQVLVNLGGNAIKFTARGEIVLSVAVLARSADTVTLQLAVRDTGIGIAPENHARIFSGFTQAEASTTRRFGGTGLGVAISQRLVGLMGGELQLDSALGQGSRFHFNLTLPVVATDDEPRPVPTPAFRALVVDDNATAREVLDRMGRALSWSVDLADSGEQALRLMQAAGDRGQPYQAVFVDWQMPGMDGWETSRQMRARQLAGSAPLVVMVTAHGREMLAGRSDVEQAMLDGFLIKPVTASMLLDAVVDAQAGRQPVRRPPRVLVGGVARLAGLRLLVVEDNANNQQVARELLEDEGALVQIAHHGQEAVEAVAAAAPPFDAVLMDLQMPVMDGFAATRSIREDLGQRQLPIIAMTANALDSDRDACLAVGMNDHVGKPFDLNHLVQVLQQQVGRTAVMPLLPPSPDLPALPPLLLAAAGAAGVDIAVALQRLGGHPGVYRRMLGRFIDDMQAVPASWQADPVGAGRWLHTVRGVAATLGAGALAAEAGRAERALATAALSAGAGTAADTAADTEPVLRQAADRLAAAVPGLNALLQALADLAGSGAVAAGPHDPRAAAQALRGLASLLQSADMAAMEAFAALQRDQAGALGDRLAPLEAAVHGLDFPRALALCQALLEEKRTS